MKGPRVEGLENCSGGKRSVEIMFLKPVKHCYLFSLIRSERLISTGVKPFHRTFTGV